MNSNRALTSFWTLVFPLFALFACVSWYVFQNTAGGRPFSYALDDPYIHLAIARNFAFHGVWGINQNEFASASSSPLWTSFLAILLRFSGPDKNLAIIWPLILNLTLSVLLVWVLSRELLRYLSPVVCGLISLVVLFFVPVPTLIIAGLEHVLHCIAIFVLLSNYAHILATPSQAINKKKLLWLLALTGVAGLIRYECLFLFVVFGFLLLCQRRYGVALLFVSIGILPLALFGGISVLQGWPPIPNSIWLKVSSNNSFLNPEKYQRIVDDYPDIIVYFLLLLTAGIWLRFKGRYDEIFVGDLTRREMGFRCALLTATFFLQVMLARLGWLFRYEAYLLFSCTLIFAPFLPRIPLLVRDRARGKLIGSCIAVSIAFFLISLRGYQAYQQTPRAVGHIRDQQVQMGYFFASHFPRKALAFNDIGAVAYYGDTRIIDLVGLANMDMARAKRNRTYNAKKIEEITRLANVEYVAIFPSWFEEETSPTIVRSQDSASSMKEPVLVPTSWTRCVDWDLKGAYFNGEVAFYATSPENAPKLREAMREFARTLPEQEKCTIIEADGQRRPVN